MTHEGPSGFALGTTSPAPPPRHARAFWTRRLVIIIVALLLLAVGFGVGQAAGASDQANLSQARARLSAVRGKLGTATQKLSSDAATIQSARAEASQATATAQAKYASREAALTVKEATVRREQNAVRALEGELRRSSISADGVYVVGRDIKAGTWHTTGDGGQNDDACYYATLNSTNTSNISDNNNFDGPETVDLSGAYAFQISGPCTWYRTSS